MIFTSLSPNTESDDLALAWKIFFSPWRWRALELRQKFEQKLAEAVGRPHVISVESGRTALFTLLKAFGIGTGDTVAVQAYTCVAVPDPVLWTGAQPLYIDCRDDLTMNPNDLLRKVTPTTKAVVIQHTFGQPARTEEIIRIARSRGLVVIEDCAHALGADIGILGDAAFYSFGRDKCISSTFGGAIATSSLELFEKVKKIVASYPEPSAGWVARQLAHPLILFLAKKTYTTLSLGKIILEFSRRTHLISKAIQPTELVGGQPSFICRKYSPALAALALHQLEKLPRFVSHRVHIAAVYQQRLKNNLNVKILQPENQTPLRYALAVSCLQQFIMHARAKGIELGDWYTTAIAPRRVEYEKISYSTEMCPNAERLAAMTINLPTHIGITAEKANTIIDYVFN